MCVSPAIIQEIKRIIKDSEIMKYAVPLLEDPFLLKGVCRPDELTRYQRGRLKMAPEEQGRTPGAGDPPRR